MSHFPSQILRGICARCGLLRAATGCFLLGAGIGTPAHGAVRLSEFLADNADGIKDGDGEKSDYIEIHNPDDVSVDLEGYSLTNNKSVPRQWRFPSLLMKPGDYLLVWASGKDRALSAAPLHTNFKLSKEGGYLALIPPESETAVTVFDPYPAQFPDRSYGDWQPEIISQPVMEGASCKWTVPTSNFAKWRLPDYKDGTWITALTGIGFDASTPGLDYSVYFGVGGNTRTAMLNRNASCYVRVPFNLTNLKGLSSMKLKLRYDDGYVAGLNGVILSRGNAPASVNYQSLANGIRDEDEAVSLEQVDVTAQLGALRAGKNVLSFQVLNATVDNTDILCSPVLELGHLDLTQSPHRGYLATPTPLAANTPAADGFTGDTKFSVNRGIFEAPFTLAITSSTPGAVIRYTLDSTPPSLTNGLIYSGPPTIATTTVVRAAAFGEGLHPSNVDTQTYVFPASVIRQKPPSGYPLTWGTKTDSFGTVSSVPADYEMDQKVVNAPEYSGLISQSLSSTLPIVSLSSAKDLFFSTDGIYADGRYSAEEIPVSMEMFGPGLDRTAQIDCGVRIHGGNARDHPKKPLRLYFRKKYGADKLRYPLYAGSEVTEFNQLLLRPGGHDGWAVPFGNKSTSLAPHASYSRDQFLRLTENDMRHASPCGRYVHVYINGLYWGIYDLQERSNADFFAAHYGGDPADWDVVHHPSYVNEDYSEVDGEGLAWEEVLARADAGVHSEQDYAAMASLVDLDNYIDSLIVRIWSGDYDWCGPIYMKNGSQEAEAGYFDNKNWYAARRSRTQPGGFVFHSWDAEMSMGSHLMGNLGFNSLPFWLPWPPPQDVPNFDSTRVGTPGSFAWPYAQLRSHPTFQRKFADHLQKHFFNTGVMTTAANQARLDSLTDQLKLAIVAESARWGDVNRNNPLNIALTPENHWKPEIDWLRNTFMAGRSALVLDQFRATGLFPSTGAPVLTPFGGSLSGNTPLNLTLPPGGTGKIYYTLDGSDPSDLHQPVLKTLVDDGAPCNWWVPTYSIGNTWRSLDGPSNPDSWLAGRNGLGFDLDTTFLPHFNTDTMALMSGHRAGVYFRMHFQIASQEEIDTMGSLSLQAKYDDGFVAALNGTVVQRANAPATELWNSSANALHPDSDALTYTPFPIPASTFHSLLRVGDNVVAVQGLNQSVNSSDFLSTVRLVSSTGGGSVPSPAARLYDPANPPRLTDSPTVKARAVSGGEWSALTEAAFITGTAASSRNLVVSELQYHPANPLEQEIAAGFTEDGDFEFVELYNISRDTIQLKDCGFKSGITFDFNDSQIQELLPGARLLVAKNPAALRFRHGSSLPVAGAFQDNTTLSNSGETLRLNAADGSVIFELTYSDRKPWPTAADGGGLSLVLVNPLGSPSDPANPGNWRVSLKDGGSPGGRDTPGFGGWAASAPLNSTAPLKDADGDGAPNLLEYVSGTNPGKAADRPRLAISTEASGTGGQFSVVLEFQRSTMAEDAALILESSPDPSAGDWTPVSGVTTVRHLDGTRDTVTVRPKSNSFTARFFRLRASLP